MKRAGNLFDTIFSVANLYSAYLDARKGKRNKRACLDFEKHLGTNINELHTQILSGTYKPAPYFKFEIYEPKKRTIYAPAFIDVVVQHAIYRIIYPLFDKTFITTSFACRKGYGTHRASDYTQQAMQKCKNGDYYLQLDIRKFFYSIDRGILQAQITRKIKDYRLIKIMVMFAEYDQPKGIPIGNLLSQLYALIYMNGLDHFIKRQLGVKLYVRYVDDFILLGLTREQCLSYRNLIVSFLDKNLLLKLSRSTIQKIKRGINFVGYRTWKTYRIIRKYSLYKFRQKVKERKLPAIVSLLGHAKRTQSLFYMLTLIKEKSDAFIQIPESYRQLYDL